MGKLTLNALLLVIILGSLPLLAGTGFNYPPSQNVGVPNLASLQAASTKTYSKGLWRNGYYAQGDATPIFYTPTAACEYTDGRATDNYHCVASADGKVWELAEPSGPIDPRNFGAKLEGQRCRDITMTNAGVGGRIQVTSEGCANFTGRVGYLAKIFGNVGGFGPTLLNTTIYSVQSATVMTLATTVTAPTCVGCGLFYGIYYGPDDSIPINNFINKQPINSTFQIQMPEGEMLMIGEPINFNARNVKFYGNGALISNTDTGANSEAGTLVIPTFVSTPTHVAAFYIPSTWGAEVSHLSILGDNLYARTFVGIETVRDPGIVGSTAPATLSRFEDLSIGLIQSSGIDGSTDTGFGSEGLAGIMIDGSGAQNDRGSIDRVTVGQMVYGVSFCGDLLTHPSACQAVEWKLDHLHFVNVYNPIDLTHGGSTQIDVIESLIDGNTFALADGATLNVQNWNGSEYNWNYPSMALPWKPNYTYARNQVVWGTDGSFHLVTVMSDSGATEPTWSVTCPNVGDVCTESGGVEYITVRFPTTTPIIAFGNGGVPAGTANISESSFVPLINYPPYGRVYPWEAGLVMTLNQMVTGSDGSFHMVTVAGTGGSTQPTWSVSCPNPGDTCTDGGATLKTLRGITVPFPALSFDNGNFNFTGQSVMVFPQTGNGPNFDLTALDFTFICRSCRGLISDYIKTDSIGSGQASRTSLVSIERTAGYPAGITNDVGDNYTNYFVSGVGAVAPFRRDYGGVSNIFGSETVNALSPPSLVYRLTSSSAGAAAYRYKVSAVSGTGESLPSASSLIDTSCVIGVSGCTITGNFYAVVGADHYKIYRTVDGGAAGTEKYVMTVAANNLVEPYYQFMDSVADGSLGAAIPTINTTGRLTVGGRVSAEAIASTGTSPALGGSCSTGSIAGGASAGSFLLTGTCTNGTVTLTMNPATTGWSCTLNDLTTPTAIFDQTGTESTTVATFTNRSVAGANNDVMKFKCVAY